MSAETSVFGEPPMVWLPPEVADRRILECPQPVYWGYTDSQETVYLGEHPEHVDLDTVEASVTAWADPLRRIGIPDEFGEEPLPVFRPGDEVRWRIVPEAAVYALEPVDQ